MSLARPTEGRRSRWIPWCFVALFAVFLAANGTMIYFALTSWPGLSADDAYRKGLAYNRDLAAAEAQVALGWQVGLSAAPQGAGRAAVEVVVKDSDGRAVKARLVRAQLRRPTHEGYDSEALLTDLGGGRYSGEIDVALPGQWDLQVFIEHADGTYRTAKRVMLPLDE